MTGNDVIEETFRLLLGGARADMNKLAAGAGANATSLSFQFDLGGIVEGSYIDVDLETYRVWSADTTAKTATVEPAQAGTTSSAHSSGALVYVNPQFSRVAAFNALNQELLSLSSIAYGLFQMKSVEFTYAGPVTDYDLANDVMDIYDVRMWLPGPTQDWVSMPFWQWKPKADVTGFASTNALHVPNGIPGRTIEVLYKAPYTTLADPSQDLLTQAGMPPEQQDILALGILLRLGPSAEIRRNVTLTQGDTRRATEVPPTAVAKSFDSVRALYQQRIAAEAARLSEKYPVRHR